MLTFTLLGADTDGTLVGVELRKSALPLGWDIPIGTPTWLGTPAELRGGGTNWDPLDREKVESVEDEEVLEDTRFANQSGNWGADLGRGGIILWFVAVEGLVGRFTLGKVGDALAGLLELLLCSKLSVKFWPLKARVKVSVSRSKA